MPGCSWVVVVVAVVVMVVVTESRVDVLKGSVAIVVSTGAGVTGVGGTVLAGAGFVAQVVFTVENVTFPRVGVNTTVEQ